MMVSVTDSIKQHLGATEIVPGTDVAFKHCAKRSSYVNRYGRRGGRGWRPWLLLPKVVFVAIWLGGLIILSALLWLVASGSPGWRAGLSENQLLKLVWTLFWLILTPALGAAVLVGVCLTMLHLRVFVRMRWWQVKTGMVMGLLAFWGVAAFALAPRTHEAHATIAYLRWLMPMMTVLTLTIVVIGRLKPRFGQNPAAVTGNRDRHPVAISTAGANRMREASASQQSIWPTRKR